MPVSTTPRSALPPEAADAQRLLFCVYRASVTDEFVDYNGHMNAMHYPLHFENATCLFFEHLDISKRYQETRQHAMFAAEQHMIYRSELRAGAPFLVQSQLLDVAPRLIRLFNAMRNAETGQLCCTQEMIFVHVSSASRRSAPFPEDVRERLEFVRDAHAPAGWPSEAGKAIEVKKTTPVPKAIE